MRQCKGIDWKAQWEAHAPNFHDGLVHIQAGNKTVVLKPGPGFGDLSHATTNLVLELMSGKIQDKHLLDVGCGSGVLSLCAVAEGALTVVGIDIDPDAIEHAKLNAKLNGMTIEFCLSRYLNYQESDAVLLMNMISSEQKQAWKSLGRFQSKFTTLISSGVLVEERSSYLELLLTWGWKLEKEQESSGWLGFIFTK